MPFFVDTKSRSIAAIKSKLHAKDLLRWLVRKNRVQIHMVTKEQARDQAKSKRWEYEVNEFNEQKAERKLKPKYAYPNAKQQQQYQERKEKGTRPFFLPHTLLLLPSCSHDRDHDVACVVFG